MDVKIHGFELVSKPAYPSGNIIARISFDVHGIFFKGIDLGVGERGFFLKMPPSKGKGSGFIRISSDGLRNAIIAKAIETYRAIGGDIEDAQAEGGESGS